MSLAAFIEKICRELSLYSKPGVTLSGLAALFTLAAYSIHSRLSLTTVLIIVIPFPAINLFVTLFTDSSSLQKLLSSSYYFSHTVRSLWSEVLQVLSTPLNNWLIKTCEVAILVQLSHLRYRWNKDQGLQIPWTTGVNCALLVYLIHSVVLVPATTCSWAIL